MSKKVQKAWERLRDHALGLPEAWEDHPWGETAIKVRKKVFLFLGPVGEKPATLSFSMKLPGSASDVLRNDWATPTGYGLGRSGWVSVKVTANDLPSQDDLEDWLEESYQAVAPKKLGRMLDVDDD